MSVENRFRRNVLQQLYDKHSQEISGEELKKKLTEELYANMTWRRNWKTLPDDLKKELDIILDEFFQTKQL